MMKTLEIADVIISPYSLAHVLRALALSGISNAALVAEDNEIHLRIPMKMLDEIVFPKHSVGTPTNTI